MEKTLRQEFDDIISFLRESTTGLFEGEPGLYLFKERYRKALQKGSSLISTFPEATYRYESFSKGQWPMFQPSHDSDELLDQITQTDPELIFELACHDGERSAPVLKNWRKTYNPDIQYIGFDMQRHALKRFEHKGIDNFQLVLGVMAQGGEIINIPDSSLRENIVHFTPDLVSPSPKVLMADHACGVLTDYAAQFGVKHDFDHMVLRRCCYNKMHDRVPMTLAGRHIPAMPFELVERMSVDYDFYMKRAAIRPDEDARVRPDFKEWQTRNNNLMMDIPVHDLLRKTITLDTAMYLEDMGYKAELRIDSDSFVIYARKD